MASQPVDQEVFPVNVIVRTVTHYYVGEVQNPENWSEGAGYPGWLRLTKCSWVAYTGRWHVALRDGTLSEVEPYPPEDTVLINLGAVVDIAPWHHELPTNAK